MKLNLKIQSLNVYSSCRFLVAGCNRHLPIKTLQLEITKVSTFLNRNNHEIPH
jgi:hypothetical protein